MVKIKRVYDAASPGDGKRILVDRLWPRGVKKEVAQVDEWIKDIAPSTELRKWFAHDTSKWQEFVRRYMLELEGKTHLISRLRAEASKRPLSLLFSAKDVDHNNAVVLKKVISKE